MSEDVALKKLIEITEYFVKCHVNAEKGSVAAKRFSDYIIALDKARYAIRRLAEKEGEAGCLTGKRG